MPLLALPAELRLQIFSHLPDLSYGRLETIGPNERLTPAISRVCRMLRSETLPLYAKTSNFIISTDDDNLHDGRTSTRVHVWLQALGPVALSRVENLQLSRHWKIKQPSRWQGHVGFYLRLQLIERVWHCTSGTYPIANDMRGMRLESVDALRHTVMRRLRPADAYVRAKTLTREDVGFVVEAMEIVAAHPIEAFDTEQSEAGRQRRRDMWARMEGELVALQGSSSQHEKRPAAAASEDVVDGRSFHTPY